MRTQFSQIAPSKRPIMYMNLLSRADAPLECHGFLSSFRAVVLSPVKTYLPTCFKTVGEEILVFSLWSLPPKQITMLGCTGNCWRAAHETPTCAEAFSAVAPLQKGWSGEGFYTYACVRAWRVRQRGFEPSVIVCATLRAVFLVCAILIFASLPHF